MDETNVEKIDYSVEGGNPPPRRDIFDKTQDPDNTTNNNQEGTKTIADLEAQNGNIRGVENIKDRFENYNHQVLGPPPQSFIIFKNPSIPPTETSPEDEVLEENHEYLIVGRNPNTGEPDYFVLNYKLLKYSPEDPPLNGQPLENIKSYLEPHNENKRANCFLKYGKNDVTITFGSLNNADFESSSSMNSASIIEDGLSQHGAAQNKSLSFYRPPQEEIDKLLILNEEKEKEDSPNQEPATTESTEKKNENMLTLGEQYATNKSFHLFKRPIRQGAETIFLLKYTDDEGEQKRLLRITEEAKAKKLMEFLNNPESYQEIGKNILTCMEETELLHLATLSDAKDPNKPKPVECIFSDSQQNGVTFEKGAPQNQETISLLERNNELNQ